MSHITVRAPRQCRAKPKPAPGSAAKARTARRNAVTRGETRAKLAAKERDGWRCTYPGCPVSGKGNVEAMHRVNAGMGRGRPCDDPSGYDTGCREHHRTGRRSIHSGHLKIDVADMMTGGFWREWWTRESLDDEFTFLSEHFVPTSRVRFERRERGA